MASGGDQGLEKGFDGSRRLEAERSMSTVMRRYTKDMAALRQLCSEIVDSPCRFHLLDVPPQLSSALRKRLKLRYEKGEGAPYGKSPALV